MTVELRLRMWALACRQATSHEGLRRTIDLAQPLMTVPNKEGPAKQIVPRRDSTGLIWLICSDGQQVPIKATNTPREVPAAQEASW